MPDAYCAPCKSRGVFISATRIVPGPGGAKIPKCEICWRNSVEPVAPIGRDQPHTHHGPRPAPLEVNRESFSRSEPTGRIEGGHVLSRVEGAVHVTVEKGAAMPRKLEIDWVKVQNDRSDGMTITALAKKYGASTPTICAHTKAAPGGPVRQEPAKMPARQSAKPRLVRSAARKAPDEMAGPYGPAIALLKARRDELDDLISRLQALNSTN